MEETNFGGIYQLELLLGGLLAATFIYDASLIICCVDGLLSKLVYESYVDVPFAADDTILGILSGVTFIYLHSRWRMWTNLPVVQTRNWGRATHHRFPWSPHVE